MQRLARSNRAPLAAACWAASSMAVALGSGQFSAPTGQARPWRAPDSGSKTQARPRSAARRAPRNGIVHLAGRRPAGGGEAHRPVAPS